MKPKLLILVIISALLWNCSDDDSSNPSDTPSGIIEIAFDHYVYDEDLGDYPEEPEYSGTMKTNLDIDLFDASVMRFFGKNFGKGMGETVFGGKLSREYTDAGQTYKFEYVYDENNNLIQQFETVDGDKVEELTFVRENGRVIKEIEKDYFDDSEEVSDYIYGDNGYVNQIITKNSDDEIIDNWKMIHDENGFLIETQSQLDDEEKSYIEYNSQGLVYKILEEYDGEVITLEFEYNSLGLATKETSPFGMKSFTYNEYNLPSVIISDISIGGEYNTKTKTVYHYNFD